MATTERSRRATRGRERSAPGRPGAGADVPVVPAPHRLRAENGTPQVWNVVVETPRRSPYKFKWEPELGAFTLHRVLPEGMTFPYDFGFVPRTCGEDGDPIDVLLFMEEPVFCGCVVPARLIGVIEARQTERGKTVRNDRLVAVASEARAMRGLRSIRDLGAGRLAEIVAFFAHYDAMFGKRFVVTAMRGPRAAERALRAARVEA